MSSIIAWFSAGITSAVACRLAIEKYSSVEIYYIDIASAHEDNKRFIADCEKWYGQKINIVSNGIYKDQFEVIAKGKYINGVAGAPCTLKLKKKVRQDLEKELNPIAQIFGFEFDKKEINRALRFKEQYPNVNAVFPLIESRLNKNECAGILQEAGIEIPEMYKLGFNNNNCIGCVKGGKWYWNNIRKHFPDKFNQMSELENMVGASCINGTFLKDLKENEGRKNEEVQFECGIFCQVEFADIMDNRVNDIMTGISSINRV